MGQEGWLLGDKGEWLEEGGWWMGEKVEWLGEGSGRLALGLIYNCSSHCESVCLIS